VRSFKSIGLFSESYNLAVNVGVLKEDILFEKLSKYCPPIVTAVSLLSKSIIKVQSVPEVPAIPNVHSFTP
jgi:hypothetical protein